MSGRFFKAFSDSESESSDPEADIISVRPQHAVTTSYAFSDEEEEAKRILRPRKEKHYEELHSIIKLIHNHKKIKDISKILTGFENLTRAFQKAKPVIEKEDKGVTPRFYIRCLCELEDFVADVWNDRKAMSKQNSKPLGTLKQKLRKYLKDFEHEMGEYRLDPDSDGGDLGSEEEDSEKEDYTAIQTDLQKAKASETEKEDISKKEEKELSDEGSKSEESDWDSSSEESSLSSDDDKYEGNIAEKFLKKDVGEGKEPKKREKRTKDRKEPVKKREGEDEEGDGTWEKVKGGIIPGERPKMFSKDEEVNHASVLKKLLEILAMRGKKRIIHRSDQIEILGELLEISESHKLGAAMEVKILFGIIGALFSYNPKHSSCMKAEMWEKCLRLSTRLIDTLIENSDISIGENIIEESENYIPPNCRVHGDVITLVEKMDEEFTKMLQAADPHSPDYIERLKDEKALYSIIVKLQNYLQTDDRGTPSELCRAYILRVDYIYYKFDKSVFEKRNRQKSEDKDEMVNGVKNEEEEETSLEIMDRLCKYIYAKDTTDRIRTQAILCHIYHHALHDNWFEARDLMLMSQLQHNILKADIPLHIIYNRALVQLGLCAFRHGNIKDAHQDLLDIQILGRAKEFLAQGLLPRIVERTPEQEKLEKRRLLPFHKHINLELLECVYLVSAMLLEIPDLAANEYSVRKKLISRSFYNQLRKNEEQPLIGLPETMREHVVAASKAMRVGNWKACRDFIVNEKMSAKVWNLFHQSDKVRAMLEQKIREESMRAYLFTYSHIYDCISLATLSEMFDLAHSTVHSIISKMVINEELMASLDEPTQMLIMHRTEPSRIQGLALQLADKVNSLVDQNEKIWENKQMGSFGSSNQPGARAGYAGRSSDQHGVQGQRYNRDNRRSQYNRSN